MTLEFEAPLRLKTQTNQSANWRVRAREVKKLRHAIGLLWMSVRFPGGKVPSRELRPPFVVSLTRIGPRRIDDDNLASSFKAVRDQIAAQLAIDDGSFLITWIYAQEKGAHGIRVRVDGY